MEKNDWSIAALLQLSGGYWGACALHAGVKLDVFTTLAGRTLTAGEVAGVCAADPRGTAMLLDALTALGLLQKEGEGYSATPFATESLSKSSASYMGHIIMHHHNLVAGWADLHQAVLSGEPIRKSSSAGEDEAARESFLLGMYNLASQLAPRIAASIDLSGRRRLLDLGGGPATYAVHFCLRNPGLTALVFDLQTTERFAAGIIGRFNLADRIGFHSGDYHADPLPAGFDVAWLSHILHADGPERCALLLAKAVAALDAGGLLLVQEFILNDGKDGPLFPALFSLNMLLATEAGRSYAEHELAVMLAAAGLVDVERLPIELPNGAGIMAGRKPGAAQQKG